MYTCRALTYCLRKCRKSQHQAGEKVAIIDGGPIGMLTLQVAKLSVEYPIALFDITEEKLNFTRN